MAVHVITGWGPRVHLVKDWADEDRDDHGRWTSGDTGSDGWPITEAPEQASIEDAHEHVASAAQSFRDAGGTVETVSGDGLRDAERELRGLSSGLRDAAGPAGLPDRAAAGIRMAFVGLSSGRANASATVQVARTAEGHIAAVMSTNPNHATDPDSIHMGFLGSTGISHGAGSALIEKAMDDASGKGLPVELEPLDDAAEDYWIGTVGASPISGGLGWSADEVKQLAA